MLRVWVIAFGPSRHGLAGKLGPSEMVKMTVSAVSASLSSMISTAMEATDCATCPSGVPSGTVTLIGKAEAMSLVAPVASTLTETPPTGAVRPSRKSKYTVPASSLTLENASAKPIVKSSLCGIVICMTPSKRAYCAFSPVVYADSLTSSSVSLASSSLTTRVTFRDVVCRGRIISIRPWELSVCAPAENSSPTSDIGGVTIACAIKV